MKSNNGIMEIEIGIGILTKIYNYKINFIMSESTNKTIGESRVRTEFNPGESNLVSQIKQKSAEFINLCEKLKVRDARLASIAQTSYEEAAMWAVKAATA